MYNKKEMLEGMKGVIDIMLENVSSKNVEKVKKLKKQVNEVENKNKDRDQNQDIEITRG